MAMKSFAEEFKQLFRSYGICLIVSTLVTLSSCSKTQLDTDSRANSTNISSKHTVLNLTIPGCINLETSLGKSLLGAENYLSVDVKPGCETNNIQFVINSSFSNSLEYEIPLRTTLVVSNPSGSCTAGHDHTYYAKNSSVLNVNYNNDAAFNYKFGKPWEGCGDLISAKITIESESPSLMKFHRTIESPLIRLYQPVVTLLPGDEDSFDITRQCPPPLKQCRLGVSSWCCNSGRQCDYDEGGCK